MKIFVVWIIIIGVSIVAAVAIINIDDLSSVIREKSMWWHVPGFLVCGYTAVTSGIIILNRIFG